MKHRIVHTLQKYVLNPPIKLALAIGLPLPGYALLETRGRKTGKPRRTPIGDGRIGNQFWLVAEHGMKAGYVRNIERDSHVRLKVREGLRYRWHEGTAHLLSRQRSPRASTLAGDSTVKQCRECEAGFKSPRAGLSGPLASRRGLI